MRGRAAMQRGRRRAANWDVLGPHRPAQFDPWRVRGELWLVPKPQKKGRGERGTAQSPYSLRMEMGRKVRPRILGSCRAGERVVFPRQFVEASARHRQDWLEPPKRLRNSFHAYAGELVDEMQSCAGLLFFSSSISRSNQCSGPRQSRARPGRAGLRRSAGSRTVPFADIATTLARKLTSNRNTLR